jgi:hypothetical protein
MRQVVGDVVGMVGAVTSVIGDAVGVVGDVAGVVRAVTSVVGDVADVGEDMIDADWICTSSVAAAVKLSALVVQVVWSTVNMKPSAMATKSGMMTIWLV